MIITPYSALDTEAELAVTAANFPALKHFFQCDEAAGATSMTDIIGGVVIPVAALTKPDANSIAPNTAADVALTSGAWVAPGSTDTLVFAVAQAGIGSKIAAGETNGVPTGFFLSGQLTTGIAGDNTTSISGTPLTGGAVYGIGMKIEFGGNLTTFEVIGSGASAYSAKAGVAMTGLDSIPTVPASAALTFLTSLYGWAIFQFADGIPSDVASAVTWMTRSWIAGEKVIYPGWKGRS